MASVLIIEDVSAVLVSLRIVLEGAGHRIVAARNGLQGLELIREGTFDLVITDIWMPGISGTEVIRRGREYSSKTRFLAITGGDPNADDPTRGLHGQDFGADRVLLKPFDVDDLLGIVAVVLDAAPGLAGSAR
jgi:CheY-like chemotaxis protein